LVKSRYRWPKSRFYERNALRISGRPRQSTPKRAIEKRQFSLCEWTVVDLAIAVIIGGVFHNALLTEIRDLLKVPRERST
jgi:hypothetical protein